MGNYSPSPRPNFEQATPLYYQNVTRHLWGDAQSGEVADWIYVSSDKIHQLVFGLPMGGAYRHSEDFRTIFGADELLYVLQGTMAFANPQTGEVHRVDQGQSIFFRRDTWQHCFNVGNEPLRVLEYFAPPPAQGTSGAYARQQPYLKASRYTRDVWLGQWPQAREQARAEETITVLREEDILWRLEGEAQQVLVGILASREHLTVGMIELLPGRHSDLETHGGDEGLYVVEGTVHIHAPHNEGAAWFELHEQDGFYVPQGAPHRYFNMSGAPMRFLFGIAPDYLPRAGK
jgi:mannose-6-phosphate isomerase-like protein (cupin superfamily)